MLPSSITTAWPLSIIYWSIWAAYSFWLALSFAFTSCRFNSLVKFSAAPRASRLFCAEALSFLTYSCVLLRLLPGLRTWYALPRYSKLSQISQSHHSGKKVRQVNQFTDPHQKVWPYSESVVPDSLKWSVLTCNCRAALEGLSNPFVKFERHILLINHPTISDLDCVRNKRAHWFANHGVE